MAMTFLEKIKAKRAAENAKKNEATKPASAVTAAEKIVKSVDETTEEPKAEVAAEAPKKESPIHGLLARKKAMAAEKMANAAVQAAREKAVKTVEASAEEPITKAEKEEPAKEDTPNDDIIIDNEPETKKEAEDSAAKTVKEEPEVKAEAEKTAEEKVIEEKTVDEKSAEEKPKRRGRRKGSRNKKTAAKAEPEIEVEEEIDKAVVASIDEDAPTILNTKEFEVQDILGSKMSYEEMAAKVMSSLEDDEQQEWQNYKAEIIGDLEKIKIAADMNPGTMKYTLMDLNDLYSKIVVPHANAKALLEALTNKEDGVCVAIRMQASTGSNDYQRRGNGYAALSNATYRGEKVNFVNLIAATRMKYIFLESIKQRIKFMSDICITMSGAMKMEERLDAQSA